MSLDDTLKRDPAAAWTEYGEQFIAALETRFESELSESARAKARQLFEEQLTEHSVPWSMAYEVSDEDFDSLSEPDDE